MKKVALKWTYVGLVSVLCLITFIFSIVTLSDKKDNYRASADFDVEKTYSYVQEFAKESRPRNSVAHGLAIDFLVDELKSFGADPIVMQYLTTYDDVVNWGGYGGNHTLVPDTLATNVLVEIKGKKADGDVLVVQAHTDSVPMGTGAYDDAVPVSAMMEYIRQIKKNNIQFENTVVFLFTDGEEEGLLGARLFADKRETFNVVDEYYINLLDRVKFVTNWEARGSGGTLIMFETTKGNYNTVKEFSKVNKSVYTNSIANFVYNQMPNGTDFSAFSNKNIQGLNFANIGEGMNYHTQFDNINNVDKSNIALVEKNMIATTEKFANIDLNLMYKTDKNAVFFSFINMFTVYYPKAVAIVFGVITLLMLVATALINMFVTKKYSFKQFGLSMASCAIGLVLAVLTAFLFKTVFGLIPALGKILGASSYNSITAVFGYMLIMIAVFTVTMSAFNKLFKVTSSEYNVLSGMTAVAFLGSILSFIMPELSFVLACPGFLCAVILLLSTAIKKWDFSKFYLGFIPFLAMIPHSMSLMILASEALGLTLAWIISILGLIAFGFILPYLLDVKEFLSKATEKEGTQPKKAVKVLTRKSDVIAATLVLVLGVTFFFVGITKPLGISTNIYGKASGKYMLFNDDTIIYKISDGEDDGKFIMRDRSSFEYLKKHYDIDGTYNASSDEYTLDLSVDIAPKPLDISYEKRDYGFEITVKKAYDGMFSMYFSLGQSGETSITKIEVTDNLTTTTFNTADFIENMKSKGEIKFRSYNDSTVKVYTTSSKLDMRYTENDDIEITNVQKIADMKDAEEYLKTGIEVSKNYTLEQ